jgi:Flp pilus assembly pilin Flp
MNRLRHQIFGLWRNQRGVAAIEYAILAPLFFMVLIMSIEVTFALLGDATLERAASQISRAGKVGIRGDCGTKVMEMLNERVSFWANTDKLRADVKVYKPGEDNRFVDDPNYEPVCNAGDRGDMVLYRLGFDKPAMTGVFTMFGLEFFHYERIVLIQNEP